MLTDALAGDLAAPLVELDDLTCGYDGRAVLDRISLRLAPGQFAGIVGPSGSGKTTVLRAILGQADIYRGAVRFPASGAARGGRCRVGYVPQLETIDWTFPVTVEQVVLMGLAAESGPFPWTRKADRRRMHELLERLGIGEYAGRHIRDLSGGQQQRAFLARALIRAPELLLLDEPTSGADIKTRHEILHLLTELNREGITVLLTTHDLNSVAAHLPWVICLNRRIVAEGTPDVVFTPEVLGRTYGAEMVVVRQGDLILVSDRLAATRSDLADERRIGVSA
ncbi:MAG: metal ABC transporter ATP-binding protein [Chloroflexota bacterium]|nr:metal ABC transporter ATP-binding protein [Chloroflexota bacterium]